ncbi:hypothetical protein [Novipirellula sp.]|uniref:hypothetical protein n=1 Tax=Novipirellula sp. TaxID=2795430 RepID=UPI003568E792
MAKSTAPMLVSSKLSEIGYQAVAASTLYRNETGQAFRILGREDGFHPIASFRAGPSFR